MVSTRSILEKSMSGTEGMTISTVSGSVTVVCVASGSAGFGWVGFGTVGTTGGGSVVTGSVGAVVSIGGSVMLHPANARSNAKRSKRALIPRLRSCVVLLLVMVCSAISLFLRVRHCFLLSIFAEQRLGK